MRMEIMPDVVVGDARFGPRRSKRNKPLSSLRNGLPRAPARLARQTPIAEQKENPAVHPICRVSCTPKPRSNGESLTRS